MPQSRLYDTLFIVVKLFSVIYSQLGVIPFPHLWIFIFITYSKDWNRWSEKYSRIKKKPGVVLYSFVDDKPGKYGFVKLVIVLFKLFWSFTGNNFYHFE